jgi:hypothetical protein
MDIDWDTWTPADHVAADAIAGPRLQQLLDAARIDLPIPASRIGEVTAILEETLRSDVTALPGGPIADRPYPPRLSIGDLAARLRDVLDNPADAAPVAHTLMALAQSAGAITEYLQSGVQQVEWSSARDTEVCASCRVNASAGPVPIGQQFPSGGVMPPGCQGCRCALLPGLP